MRGKDFLDNLRHAYVGITPAYAGKSSPAASRACIMRDHPRLCGEKTFASGVLASFAGSPPPMRGKGSILEMNVYETGITPAYAGKSPMVNMATYPI